MLRRFDVHRATSVKEAVRLRQMFGEDVRIQGFGTTSGDDPDLEAMVGGPLEDQLVRGRVDVDRDAVGVVRRPDQPADGVFRCAGGTGAARRRSPWSREDRTTRPAIR